MKLPNLATIPTSRDLVDAFGGYNHNLRIGNGEFYDMKNLTSSYYPVLSPRPKRGESAESYSWSNQYHTLSGLVEKDTLCYVDGRFFVFNGDRYDLKLSPPRYDENGIVKPKNLISMGAYVIIMPDKKYFNTANVEDYGDIEAKIKATGAVTFELCKLDGEGYTDEEGNAINLAEIARAEAPEEPQNMDLWIDTSSEPHTLKQYSTANEQWVSIATTYIKITFSDYGSESPLPFEGGDGVTISGITETSLQDLNNTMVVWAKGDNYIVVTGMLNEVVIQTGGITVIREMPDMDFVIESKNRLWGCKYGIASNGEWVNEIRASKLGDFKNWNCFAGISTDSYVVSLGTDGQFTGAITHMGYPLFFKENCMHKVYGDTLPFGVQDTACRGVQKGCNKSLSIVNEVLYYKARTAVCAYDGSLPVEISSALGEVNYSNAAAGTLGNKYYISMADDKGVYHLFAYDTRKGMWHREDNTHAIDFCYCKGKLYYIEPESYKVKDFDTGELTDLIGYHLRTVIGSGDDIIEDNVSWMAETGIIGVDMPDKKYISRIDVRLTLEVGARVFFYIQYDSGGSWEHLFTMTGTNLRTFAIPIKPKRCDHLRLRIEGVGESRIYSICKTVETGSDI